MPRPKTGRTPTKQVCVPEREYQKLVEARACYYQDTGNDVSLGKLVGFLALVYLGSRFLDQQRKQQQGDSHGRQ